jgi:hypothetical protein
MGVPQLSTRQLLNEALPIITNERNLLLFDIGNAAWQQRRRDHSVDRCVRGRALIFIFEQIGVFMTISATA